MLYEVITDLWGFKDVKELNKDTADMPDMILKEQISLLSEKTNFVLCGKSIILKVKNPNIQYGLATVFDIFVPTLDNYSKTILIMYTNPDTEYPVAITVGSTFEEDCEYFCPTYTCKDYNEFIAEIEGILSSEDISYNFV